MIELKDFIKATLRDIIEAVSETQEAYGDQRALVNPELYGGVIKEGYISTAGGAVPVERVEFDVAVVEGGSKEAGGGASIKVFSVGADGAGKLVSTSEATSRVRFSIPIALPPAPNPHQETTRTRASGMMA